MTSPLPQDVPRITLQQLLTALINGFDGMKMTGGDELTADKKPDNIKDVSEDRLPYLLFDVGSLTFQPWTAWEEATAWDVSAVLKVKGEPGEADTLLLEACQDLVFRTKILMGLPVDDKGRTIPYGPDTAAKFDRGQLTFLADRGAPYIKQFNALPSDGRYGQANIVFHLESVLNLDPRILRRATVGNMGIVPVPAGEVFADETQPYPGGLAVIADSDRVAFGGYDTADPRFPSGNGQETNRVAGVDPGSLVRTLNVTPYIASLSAGSPTAQLSVVAIYGNYSSVNATTSATWTSTNASVATVNGSGLVTRVAVGSCTVSCTYNGSTSNSVAVTCS